MAPISFPGIGSGIDVQSLVQALNEQYTLSNRVRESQIASLSSENTALDELATKLTSVAGQASTFSSLNGGAAAKSASTSDSGVVIASADSSAATGSYTVTVSSLAKAATGSFDRGFKASDETILEAGDSAAGNLTFTVGQGDAARSFSVAVDGGTTAQDLVSAVNSESDGSVQASLVNVGTESAPDYRVTFQTTELGEANGSLTVRADNDALLGAGALTGATVDQATNARFSVSGISGEIERSSNTANDIIAGVSLTLQGTGSATVTVQNDGNATASQVANFVSAFNDLAQFVNQNDAVSVSSSTSGAIASSGPLSGTEVDERAVGAIRTALASARADDGRTLASFGISTNRDGTLSFDEEAFSAAYAEDPQAAAQALTAFADALSGTGGAIDQYTGYGRAIDTAQAANEQEIAGIKNKISQVESSAAERTRALETQFVKLEGTLGRLSSGASALSAILSTL
ncbi:MAG: flagellar filament capping protein FliD [Bdellovibrionales bacterium]|nr:flagellar filament capping protein FliD [Bdellovibrionales bacterium]